MKNFLECGSFISLVVKWHLSGVIKLFINFNLQKIINQHLSLGTIFINKLLIELNSLNNEKKNKKNLKRLGKKPQKLKKLKDQKNQEQKQKKKMQNHQRKNLKNLS